MSFFDLRARRAASRRATFAAAAALLVFPLAVAAAPTRPDAEPYLGLPPTSELSSPTEWKVEPAFPKLSFTRPVFMIPEPASSRLWVAEQAGRIVWFEDDEETDALHDVLDLRAVTKGEGDSGLLSFAFHPEYANPSSPSEGFLYVGYAYRPNPNLSTWFRLSRFHVDRATGVADPASELVLIEQLDQQSYHQGGALLFRPSDGYLYVTVGDEGGTKCSYANCQKIDKDLFSGVLRLDVDRIGGDTSHAPPRQPASGTTANYFVPSDNPFVGQANALEEFYAIGLRSPHRMTIDPVDDVIWIADVGQSSREELDVLAPGANYQWNVREGFAPFEGSGEPPSPLLGVWTDPLLDYPRSSGGTIIGGYVYRGTKLPELVGRYVYGDYLSGRIWALRYEKNEGGVDIVENVELLRTSLQGQEDGITSFGIDVEGELYVLTLGEKLQRLVAADKDPGNMPLTLSATGLFSKLETLTAIEALVPYEVRVPLWSDGAAKKRWVSVPSGEVVDYSPSAPWSFPPGSVFVKHFEMQLDEGDPSSVRRLETRVLVVQPDRKVYGVTYRWREDQSDADLLTTTEFEELPREDLEGTPYFQRYQYPGPLDCLSCHDQGSGFVLGHRARQFEGMPSAEAGDTLGWFAEAGYLDVAASGLARPSIPDFASLDDEEASLELRVRSWLDVNCAHCHGGKILDRALWDARLTTPLNHQGIVGGTLLGDYNGEDDRVVVPGDIASSILHLRASTNDASLRMPPLARNVRDAAFVSLLEDWIVELPDKLPPPPLCGDSVPPYDAVTAADALGVLRAAVALNFCMPCICDVTGNGSIGASDALRVLRRAVGESPTMVCPSCM